MTLLLKNRFKDKITLLTLQIQISPKDIDFTLRPKIQSSSKKNPI